MKPTLTTHDGVAKPSDAGAPGPAGALLFIGDSFTEGVGVEFDSTFVGRIAAHVPPRGLSVLNAGVSSYAPSVDWRKVVDVVARRDVPVSEVVVFIDPYDMVDETNYSFDADTNVHMHQEFGSLQPETTNPADPLTVRARVWWRIHSLVAFQAVRGLSRLVSDPCKQAGAIDDVRCKEGWKPLSVLMKEYGPRGLPLARAHMSSLAGFLRDRPIPLTVVIYPWRIQLDTHDPATDYTSSWSSWGAREHVPVIDLFPAFFAGADRMGLRAMTDSMTIAGDEHWNSAGHGFVLGAFLGLYCAARLGAGQADAPLAAAACQPGRDSLTAPLRMR